MSDLDIGICTVVLFAFIIGFAIPIAALIRAGRITVVVVRHSLLRPRGPDGRFLRDRDIAVGTALDAVQGPR